MKDTKSVESLFKSNKDFSTTNGSNTKNNTLSQMKKTLMEIEV